MTDSPFDLGGKRALVTGANGGIGLGIAEGLARAGADVVILARNEQKNAAALEQLRKIGTDCRAVAFDLGAIDGIGKMYDELCTTCGAPDILVNCAGITERARADLLSIEQIERVLRVNLTAPFVLSQCFARQRIGAGADGAVIMIASLMSEAARPTTAAYTASKGGIRQLVRALAVDWASHRIRVNGIGPGYIATDLTRPLVESKEFSEWVVKRTPLGRWGAPQDLRGAAVFLASGAAEFITGQILYVDGGWLATF
jgi:gluconate 5-dehydrogenase